MAGHSRSDKYSVGRKRDGVGRVKESEHQTTWKWSKVKRSGWVGEGVAEEADCKGGNDTDRGMRISGKRKHYCIYHAQKYITMEIYKLLHLM